MLQVLARMPRRLLPVVWVVTLLVASGAATPRLRVVHRDRVARATAQRAGGRSSERQRSIAPDPNHGALASHAIAGGEPRGPRRLAAVVPARVPLTAPTLADAQGPAAPAVAAPRWVARPHPARGPPA